MTALVFGRIPLQSAASFWLQADAERCELTQTRRHHFRHRNRAGRRNIRSTKTLRQPRSTLEMWCPVRGCGFESHALRFRSRYTAWHNVAQVQSGSPLAAARFRYGSGRFTQIDARSMRAVRHHSGNLSGRVGTIVGTVCCCLWQSEGSSSSGCVGSGSVVLVVFLPAVPTKPTRPRRWPHVALVGGNRIVGSQSPTRYNGYITVQFLVKIS